MTYKVYLYGKCSTCQKALRFLEKINVSYKIIDISQTPPTIDELKQMLNHQNGDIKKLFNTSGILYRELQLSQKLPTMLEGEALILLSKNGMLVKRPFLLGKDLGLIGFHEEQWKNILYKRFELLEELNLIGCFEGEKTLSQNYKNELSKSLGKKF